MKKYELTEEIQTFDGITLHRIRALRNVRYNVKAGDLGGWIEEEKKTYRKPVTPGFTTKQKSIATREYTATRKYSAT